MLSDSMKKKSGLCTIEFDNQILLEANFWQFDHPKPSLHSCEVAHKNLARSLYQISHAPNSQGDGGWLPG